MAITTHQSLIEGGYLYAESAFCATCQQEQSASPIPYSEMNENWKAGVKFLLSDFLQSHASHRLMHKWFEFLPEKAESVKQLWADQAIRFRELI